MREQRVVEAQTQRIKEQPMVLTVGGGAQDLPADDDVMITGQMGDCVSVIVLFNCVDGTYRNIRGWHGLGGSRSINMKQMMRKVPNETATQVLVIPGRLQQSEYAMMQNLRHVRKVKKHGYENISIRYIENIFCGAVNRQGVVSASDVLY